jgi:RNA polymerase sigma-70 factor (ECF subfamily)
VIVTTTTRKLTPAEAIPLPPAPALRWRLWSDPGWIFWLFSELVRRHNRATIQPMAHQSDEPIPTRRSLIHRLKDWDDSASWRDFFDTYWKLIYGVARKAGLTDSEAQDVVQETVIAVAKKMPQFTYDPEIGSFKAWLKQLTRWRISDQLRKKCYERKGEWFPRERTVEKGELPEQEDPSGFDLERVWNEEWEKTRMDAALKRVRARSDPTQYQAFYLHVVKQQSAREVADRLEIKLADVYVAKYKISALLKKAIQALEDSML